ncbi:MAG: galactokinase, partial [Actinomycetota bacterium]|nr:galactokinase [Actinomycetota bacterium]
AQAGHQVPGADLRIGSDVPVGAGLASSHALECAVALALTGLAGVIVDHTELALIVQRAENGYVGAPTGAMDQMASLHGSDGHAVLFDAQAMTVELVPCDVGSAGLDLVVVDTHTTHHHAGGEYGTRRTTCHRAARRLGVATLREVDDLDAALARLADDSVAMRRVRHVVTENARVVRAVAALRANQWAALGPLLTGSHVSLRDDYEVTVPQLDVAVEAAMDAGALGARMTGGGFGGSVLVLAERRGRPSVEDAVAATFAERGWPAPTFRVVRPSRGAGRDG